MRLKSCKLCGTKPKTEIWNSGGCMYMIRCPHLDCPVPVDGYPKGRNLEEVKQEWNKRAGENMDGGDEE